MKNFISINFIYIRKINHLSQEEIGTKLGVSYHSVGSYERGVSLPPIITIQVFCSEFSISIDDFVNVDLSKVKIPDPYYVNEKPAKYQLKEPIELYERMLKTKDDVIEQKEKIIESKNEQIAILDKNRIFLEAIINQASKF